jgi:ribonuclease HI
VILELDFEIPWDFFDGEFQWNPSVYIMGVLLLIKKTRCIYIKYSPGFVTNNKEEFVVLWSLLEATKEKDVKKLHILGDSKLVIDWAREKNNFQNIQLDLIMRDIKLAYKYF